jgi:hypothetical protein
MKKIIITLVALYSFSTMAQFSGQWIGEGVYQTHRSKGDCSLVFFDFELTNLSLDIYTGGYECGLFKAEYPASHFEIVNGFIFYKGENVGTASNDRFFLTYLDGVFELTLRYENGRIDFHERWYENGDLLEVRSKLVPYKE